MAAERRSGQIVDGWHLIEPLGEGGNADVWLAEKPASPAVALKILRQTRPASEPYRRFRSEMEVLRRLGTHPGVLPLLEASLPERPTSTSPAWLAMPRAVPIRVALGADAPLHSVVEAIASIASTLDKLAADHSLLHRDIKPENLYRLGIQWCIGDFGLVDYPEKEELTAPGRFVGPRHYLAPELLNDPESAGGPADVFSLAKSLWVLATRQNYPFPGSLHYDYPQLRIGSYVTSVDTRPLDLLVSRATHPDPSSRPSMPTFAGELHAWLRLSTPVELGLDTEGLRDRFFPIIERHRRAAERQYALTQHVESLFADSEDALKQIGAAIEHVTGLTPRFGRWPTFMDDQVVVRFRAPFTHFNQHYTAYVADMPLFEGGVARTLMLTGGLFLGVTSDLNEAHILATHVIRIEGQGSRAVWSDTRICPTESALERSAVTELLKGLSDHVADAAAAVADVLDGRLTLP